MTLEDSKLKFFYHAESTWPLMLMIRMHSRWLKYNGDNGEWPDFLKWSTLGKVLNNIRYNFPSTYKTVTLGENLACILPCKNNTYF